MGWLFWKSGDSIEPSKPRDDDNGDDRNEPSTKTLRAAKSIKIEKEFDKSFHAHLNTNNLANLSPWAYVCIAGGFTFGSWTLYRRYLRRIPNVDYLVPHKLRKKKFSGYVTSVGDGDGFRFYHTPGGRLAGFGWLRSIPTDKKVLKNQTWSVRLAGVDAPESAHFGKPAQPYGPEAHAWLQNRLEGRFVRILPWARDQYGRVVATAWFRKWGIWPTDVSREMLDNGLATVYEAKTGAEFGGQEGAYRIALQKAQDKRKGMWQEPGLVSKMLYGNQTKPYESPREYKQKYARQEHGK